MRELPDSLEYVFPLVKCSEWSSLWTLGFNLILLKSHFLIITVPFSSSHFQAPTRRTKDPRRQWPHCLSSKGSKWGKRKPLWWASHKMAKHYMSFSPEQAWPSIMLPGLKCLDFQNLPSLGNWQFCLSENKQKRHSSRSTGNSFILLCLGHELMLHSWF